MIRTEIMNAYSETAARGAGQVELVVMLYDLLLDDMRRGIEAIRARDVEARTFEIKHALNVLEQLQGTLNFDEGGEAARNMDRLYSIVRAKLLEAHLKVSEETLQRQIALLTPIRDAWRRVGQPVADPASPSAGEPTVAEWRV
ncbi:MAG: flagellar export chaperone FliS [Acidobacteriaceae bacterium]